MKILKDKGTIQKLLTLLIIIASLILLVRWSRRNDEARFQNGDFAIGYIDKFTFGLGKGSSTGYYYHFSYNDKKYHYFNDQGVSYDLESWQVPSRKERKKIKVGDMFLVIFDENGSRLFYKYPIKDSADFRRYIKQIEIERAD